MARAKRNLLTSHKADVSYARGGLTISIAGVPADDAALVAKSVLNAFRELTAAGYDELIEHTASTHAGGYDVSEDADIEPVTVPPSGQRRPMGFR